MPCSSRPTIPPPWRRRSRCWRRIPPCVCGSGPRLVEDQFSNGEIGRQIVALYDRLLGRSGKLLQDHPSSG
jgi:hypothetical protein